MFAVIKSGVVARYPADPQKENPTTSFGSGWRGGQIGDVEYVFVNPTVKPAHDAMTQNCVEAPPIEVGGVWVQQWEIVAATAQEQNDRLVAAQTDCIARINAECRQRLFNRFGPPEEQISRSLGIYGDAERDALAPGIAAMIDASNDASDLVLVATTVAEAEAVQPNWPVI